MRIIPVSLLFCALVLTSHTVRATTVDKVELKCPVCAAKCTGYVIMSTNSFGGQDRDFLTRARGWQAFLVTVVTCPKCRYSGFSGDFEEKVDEDLKKAIQDKKLRMPDYAKLSAPSLRQAKEEGQAQNLQELPAWVKYDLICQIAELQKTEDMGRADLLLKTSWAVRLEVNPFATMDWKLSDDQEKWLDEWLKGFAANRKEEENDVQERIAIGQGLLSVYGGLAKDCRRPAAMLIGRFLRDTGEHEALLKALPRLKDAVSAEEWKWLEPQTKAAIELERKYQQQAVDLFVRALGTKDGVEEEARPVVGYLVGELYRRLGQRENAMKYFDLALKDEKMPEGLMTYVKEQRVLAAKLEEEKPQK